MTVSKQFADDLIAAGGLVPHGEGERVIEVIEYDTLFGTVAYGLVFEGGSADRYYRSSACLNPRLYWRAAQEGVPA